MKVQGVTCIICSFLLLCLYSDAEIVMRRSR